MSRFLSQFQWSLIVAQARSVMSRFPTEVVVATLAAVLGVIIAHEAIAGQQSLLTAMLLASPVLLALQLVVTLVFEQYHLPRWWRLGGRVLAFLGAAAMTVSLHNEIDSDAVPVQVATAWITALACLVLVWYGKGPAVLWQMTKLYAWRFVLTTVFASVLSGGLALALGALQVLFGLDVPDALYGDVSALVNTLFATLFFLAGIPVGRIDNSEVNDTQTVPMAVRWLVQFVLLPLVIVFTVILYAYAIKVAFFSNLEGSVAGYIVALGIISISAWVMTWPLRTSVHHRILALYHRWLGAVLLPLAIMLIVAVAIRIADYGVTPERYALAAFTAVFTGATIMLLLQRWVDLRVLPMIIATVGAVTAIGPFDSRHSSIRSQSERLQTMLRTEKVLDQRGMLDTTAFQQQSDSVRWKVFDGIRAISDVDTAAAVQLLQRYGVQATVDATTRAVQFAGMGTVPEWKSTEGGRYWSFPTNEATAIRLQGASEAYAVRVTNSNRDTTVVIPLGDTTRATSLRIAPKSTILTIYDQGRPVDRIDMSAAASQRDVLSDAGLFRAVILSGEVTPTFVASLEIVLVDLRPKPQSIQQ